LIIFTKKVTTWTRATANYFYKVGVIGHFITLFALLFSLVTSAYIYSQYNLPAQVFFQRTATYLANSSSPLLQSLSAPTAFIASEFLGSSSSKNYRIVYKKPLIGANEELSFFQSELSEENNKQLKPHHQRLANFDLMKLRTIYVNSTKELLSAIKNALPGDDIIIAAGIYRIKQRQIYLQTMGTGELPIRLRAVTFGEVQLELDTLEGLVMTGDYWLIENLKIKGVCAVDQQCEHAIHIVGAQHLIVRNNELVNFNSTVKANTGRKKNRRYYPDNILFEHNNIYNEHSRQTNTSVTLLDVVAGSNWVVRKNFIANNSKHGSDYVSYGLFLKGNGENGLIEKNIVDCEWSLPDDGHVRIGISIGGGGTGEQYCRGGSCPVEYSDGVIENNLVVNCSQDVGIYLNKASKTTVIHNTLLNSLGLDVRFPESSATVINNVVSGKIRARDDGIIIKNDNVELDKTDFNSTLSVISQSTSDLCGFTRFKFSSIGALSSECKENLALELVTVPSKE
jgi:parallel beta-helix repeat protein